jgi:hypothetical protein
MILMAPSIIDFIGGMHYLGQWEGGGPLDTPGPLNGIKRHNVHNVALRYIKKVLNLK